jgi:hypothetical protein
MKYNSFRKLKVSVIHNQIFIRTTSVMMREKGKDLPLVVPERQMRLFITVPETHNVKFIYLKPRNYTHINE